MTVLLGLTADLAEGFCDGVVAIAVDVQGGLGATTWIAPVAGRVAGFVSSDLGGGSVGRALGNVGAFGYRRWYIKKRKGGDGCVLRMLGWMGKGYSVQSTLTLLCAERAFCRPCVRRWPSPFSWS